MSVPQLKRTRLTYEEYLRREASSPVKHEFRRGELFAMAGGTYEHGMIISNLVREVGNALKGKPCRVLESNMKVYIQARDESTYPDAMIVCGDPEFGSKGKDRTTILNPRVLIEVLSPSTQDYDKEGKFELYAELKSFEEYVVVSSDHARVMTAPPPRRRRLARRKVPRTRRHRKDRLRPSQSTLEGGLRERNPPPRPKTVNVMRSPATAEPHHPTR
jgi:Uma2 family endonuclease